jgi:hypothetical protein
MRPAFSCTGPLRDRAAFPAWQQGLYALVRVEPMTGIEPAYSAWEADVLPLNYIGGGALTCGNVVGGVSLAGR